MVYGQVPKVDPLYIRFYAVRVKYVYTYKYPAYIMLSNLHHIGVSWSPELGDLLLESSWRSGNIGRVLEFRIGGSTFWALVRLIYIYIYTCVYIYIPRSEHDEYSTLRQWIPHEACSSKPSKKPEQ